MAPQGGQTTPRQAGVLTGVDSSARNVGLGRHDPIPAQGRLVGIDDVGLGGVNDLKRACTGSTCSSRIMASRAQSRHLTPARAPLQARRQGVAEGDMTHQR